MKRRLFLAALTLICAAVFYLPSSFAQEAEILQRFDHPNSLTSLAFSPDGQTIALGSDDGPVILWNVSTGDFKNAFETRTAPVRTVAFSPDGQILASGHNNGLLLWDASTSASRHAFEIEPTFSLAFSPDGQTLAAGSRIGVIILNVSTGTHNRTLSDDTDEVNSVAFSPDGQTLVSLNYIYETELTIVVLWDLSAGSERQVLDALEDYNANSIAFSPDGQTLAIGTQRATYTGQVETPTLILWDIATGTIRRTLDPRADWAVNSVAFSPDEQTLASANDDGTVILWDVETGNIRQTLDAHTTWVNSISIAFSPDGQTFASVDRTGNAILWDVSAFTTPSDPTDLTVSLSPASIVSPAVGEQLILSLDISDGENIAGYEATVSFDTSALRYVESSVGTYFPPGAIGVPPSVTGNRLVLAAVSLGGGVNGDGTLATVTFEVLSAKASTVGLSGVLLADTEGGSIRPRMVGTEITERLPEDVNGDGVVNILDLTLVVASYGEQGELAEDVNGDRIVNIIDLTLVAGAFSETAASPSLWFQDQVVSLRHSEVASWLRQARAVNLSTPQYQRGIKVLEQLLAALTPAETTLLANYPNPFNPETWIPYQLATPADVTLRIYAVDGNLIRRLSLGHKTVGLYQSRSRAAYWDGKNEAGEPVASGVYFYTLEAGDFNATRKMLIRK